MKKLMLIVLCFCMLQSVLCMNDAVPYLEGKRVINIIRDEDEHGEGFLAYLEDMSRISASVNEGVENFGQKQRKFHYLSVQHYDSQGISLALSAERYYDVKRLYNRHFRERDAQPLEKKDVYSAPLCQDTIT